MRIVFMGSDEFACPCLDVLMSSTAYTVCGVVTQPDRPKGRSLKKNPCAVRAHLKNVSFPVITPLDINESDQVNTLRMLSPELIVVVAYGQILKPDILTLAPNGCINVHASLLPKFRGSAPVQWAIARGETTTGVTAMYINEAMDAGDIIDQIMESIRTDDTAGTLSKRLAIHGACLLDRTLDAVHKKTVSRISQVEEQATYAPKLKKSDGQIDWDLSAVEINNRIRGFNPWPGCYCEFPDGRIVRVLKACVEEGSGISGSVLEARGDGPLIQTGKCALRLLELQPQGSKSMNGISFLCGHPIKEGERLL